MRRVEQEYGKPLEQVIRELYVDHDRLQADVARELGVSGPTLSIWMLKLGIPARRWALPNESPRETAA
jgi:transcriptional regulator with PAS, ATPase and Fis domain